MKMTLATPGRYWPMATDFKKTIAEAKVKGEEIEVLARILAEKMQALHGVPFRILLDHQIGFLFLTVDR
ncbi:MAG: hypothetical protein E5X45_26295 [Mesorhizobium sp.]|nr:MAG: hypothetical protein E5X66_05980 [Mesorhizobium sp.]TJV78011.1 MAG: hypothetical protein E5X45_26295 [Mesorhizobium sp.]